MNYVVIDCNKVSFSLWSIICTYELPSQTKFPGMGMQNSSVSKDVCPSKFFFEMNMSSKDDESSKFFKAFFYKLVV